MHILLDASRSMDYGTTSDPRGESWNKFGYAQRVAAALGYVALAGGDRLTLATLRGEAPTAQFGPARGRGQTMRLLKFLQDQPTAGSTNLDAALRRYLLGPRRAGVASIACARPRRFRQVFGLTRSSRSPAAKSP